MATYYVSADSVSTNWTNALNISTPCTVATAETNAVAGDFVRFLDGDYFPPNASGTQVPSWYPRNSGTLGNPITWISHNRHGAVIHSANNQGSGVNRTGFGIYNADYITFSGFTIDSDLEAGVAVEHPFIIESSRNIIVEYMNFPTGWAHTDHTNGASIGVYGTAVREGQNIHIRYCDITGPTNDLTPTEAVVNASGIYIFECSNVYVYNNTIHDCNNGVSWKTEPTQIYVYNNFIYNINRAAFYITPEVTGRDDYEIHHNLLVNCNRFFDAEEAPSGGGTFTNLSVYNNTLYNDASHPLGVVYVAPSGTGNVSGIVMGQDAGSQTARGVQFYNNIIRMSTTSRGWEIHDDLTSDAMIGVPFNYNCYYTSSGTIRFIRNGSTQTTLSGWVSILDDSEEVNSIDTNPSFVNAGGAASTDYKLAGGSPCIGTGYGSVDMGCWQGQTAIGNMAVSGTLALFL